MNNICERVSVVAGVSLSVIDDLLSYLAKPVFIKKTLDFKEYL